MYYCAVCGDRIGPEAENHDWEGCCSQTCLETKQDCELSDEDVRAAIHEWD